jgi:hypothetical protein
LELENTSAYFAWALPRKQTKRFHVPFLFLGQPKAWLKKSMAQNIVLGGKKTRRTKWCGPIEKFHSFLDIYTTPQNTLAFIYEVGSHLFSICHLQEKKYPKICTTHFFISYDDKGTILHVTNINV